MRYNLQVFSLCAVNNKTPLTLGLDINIGVHQFQLTFRYLKGLNENQFLTNLDIGWLKRHIHFGFNMTWVLNRKIK
jgi:hypothetical protein